MRDITPKGILLQGCNKDTKTTPKTPSKDHFKAQLKRVDECFLQEPRTMKQVSILTGIDRANICRYCKKLRQYDKILAVKKGICPITKHRAIFWTTNPDLLSPPTQLSIFN
jgi:hypothetical protein